MKTIAGQISEAGWGVCVPPGSVRQQKLLGCPGKYSRYRPGRAAVVLQDKRLKKKKWAAEQSESILILWISLLFLPNEMTFISANPIYVAKIFIFIQTDIVGVENEAWWDGKSVWEVCVCVCSHASFFLSSLLQASVSDKLSLSSRSTISTWAFLIKPELSVGSFLDQWFDLLTNQRKWYFSFSHQLWFFSPPDLFHFSSVWWRG